MKSYNTMNLRGDTDYSDHQFKVDMMENAGINIPDQLLYTPDMNQYVVDAMYQKNLTNLPNLIDPSTGLKHTERSAKEEAGRLRLNALKNIGNLTKQSQ
jgi:predicted metalloendopeptidase